MATVLVVDDHAANRDLVVTLLKHAGHLPLEAADGLTALQLVREQRPELVVCDLLMPSMDGFEFVRQLRAEPLIAATQVVFYTATYLEKEARQLALACGVTQVLVKPAEPEEILRVVAVALSQTGGPQEHQDAAEFEREHLRLITNKLAAKVDELEGANLRLAALTELNLQLASELDPQALLEKVCRGARDLLGARIAVLAARAADNNAPDQLITWGLDAAQTERLSGLSIDAGKLGQVLLDGRPQRFVNPAGDPVSAGLADCFPAVNAGLLVPLASPKQIHGWLLLIDKIGAPDFSPHDEHLLSIHAAQAGRIYETGLLYLAMQRSSQLLIVEMAERKRATEGLLESELRFRQLAENIRDVFFLMQPDSGDFVYVSLAYEQIFGKSCASLYADPQSWRRAIHPDDQHLLSTWNDAGARASAFEVEYRILRPDASQRSIRARGFPINDAAGQVYRVAGIAEDVTEQRLAEQKMRRISRVFELLSSINALIVRVSSADDLFREACRLAVEVGAYRLAWIGVIDADASHGSMAAWHGGSASLESKIRLTRLAGLPDSDRPCCRALRSQQAVITNDIENDPAMQSLREDLLACGLRAQASFPLIVNQQVIGVLTLNSGQIDAFDEQEVKLLLDLAGDIAFALDHIQKGERLNYLAYYDALTGLANNSLLTERIEQALAAAQAEQQMLALLVLDIERFKDINHVFGRHGGDALLRQLSARLSEQMGEQMGGRAQLARIGADHFAILLPDVRGMAELGRLLAEQYRLWFDPPFMLDGQALQISAKLGVAVYPADGQDAPTLLRNAEAAVRLCKASTEWMLFYDPRASQLVAEKLAFETQLRRALEREEFVLYYQPKVDVDTRQLCGVEALIRWNSPELGLVPPLRFITLLEETGLIVPVGLWALRRAALDHLAWSELGLAAPRIAVNVSAVQLREPDFVAKVEAILRQAGLPHGLDIELTESLIMEDVEATIDKLQALRGLDMHLSIDDFGTGYSSLAYLSKLPANLLKIDRAFIDTMLEEPANMTLVATMISMAHSLRLKVVAEGVETEEQAKILRLLRCDQMQGFLVSRPVPFEQISDYLRLTNLPS
ncbi:MAG: EAL domain-containing protein [Paucibacter sp.]|nr:EAL domain-containing protein [Roseateles sp.]